MDDRERSQSPGEARSGTSATKATRTALLVVDMLNTYDHPDAGPLREHVPATLDPIAGLVARARDEDCLVVYVNDNLGPWTSNRDAVVSRALEGPHGHLVEPILPADDVTFVLKARHSAFFQTPLEYLLNQNDIGRLVMVGQVTEQCILYSALDAYIRHFDVVIPRNGVVGIDDDLADAALRMMEGNMSAEILPADAIDLTS